MHALAFGLTALIALFLVSHWIVAGVFMALCALVTCFTIASSVRSDVPARIKASAIAFQVGEFLLEIAVIALVARFAPDVCRWMGFGPFLSGATLFIALLASAFAAWRIMDSGERFVIQVTSDPSRMERNRRLQAAP